MAEKSGELEGTSIEIIPSEELRAKKIEEKQSVSQRPTGNMKHIGIHVTGAPREERGKQEHFLERTTAKTSQI